MVRFPYLHHFDHDFHGEITMFHHDLMLKKRSTPSIDTAPCAPMGLGPLAASQKQVGHRPAVVRNSGDQKDGSPTIGLKWLIY